MSGWVKLHRSIQEHWLWSDEPFSKGQAWVDLIMKANHKARKINIKGTIISLEIGQQARSERTLSNDWKWSRGKVRRFLKALENNEMIVHQTVPVTSIISICNYSTYQTCSTSDSTIDDTSDSTTHEPQAVHKQECKNGKNEKKPNIPYQDIVELYNSTCVDLTKVQILTDKRKRVIKKFWDKSETHREMEFYGRFFNYVTTIDFLCGRTEPTGNRTKPFKADLEWILNLENFAKIIEGKY